MNNLDLLYQKMIDYYEGDAKRIQHFVKVHSFASLIALKLLRGLASIPKKSMSFPIWRSMSEM